MLPLLLALLLTQPHPKPKPAAYLCQGSNSYAYHSTTHCEGLAWCTTDTKKMTEAQAKKLGRYPCGRCH